MMSRADPLKIAVVAGVVILAGCGQIRSAAGSVGGALAAPLEDVGLRRVEIPTVLLQAQANPYDLRNMDRCSTITAEVRRLDEALGPDRDEPPAPDGRNMVDRGADAAGGVAIDTIRDTATDFIPARSWVRRLSGAERHSREVQDAIQAGRIRRAFLKGTGMQRNCAPPAAPSWFTPSRRR